MITNYYGFFSHFGWYFDHNLTNFGLEIIERKKVKRDVMILDNKTIKVRIVLTWHRMTSFYSRTKKKIGGSRLSTAEEAVDAFRMFWRYLRVANLFKCIQKCIDLNEEYSGIQ